MSFSIVLRRSIGSSLVALIAVASGTYACSSDPDETSPDAAAPVPSPTDTAPARDGGAPTPEASVEDAATSDSGDSGSTRPAPVFLSPGAYEDAIVIDPNLPFGVVARFSADGDVLGARWGNHGGPMVTTQVYTAPDAAAPAPGVVRYTVPAGATGASTAKNVVFTKATGLPTTFFYGADGMVDLPFGNFAVLTYTGSGAGFPGEALLYSKDYDRVVARAKSNGVYSAVGAGTKTFVYSALSPFASAATTSTDNGLYASELCNQELVATGACKPPAKLFGWTGNSGPVAVDGLGNAFVGASLSGGDAIYGAAAADVANVGAATRVELVTVTSLGTSSLAAIAPEGSAPGFVVAKTYDGASPSPAYAQAYTSGTALQKRGSVIAEAVKAGPAADGFSVFSSSLGDLWIAVDLKSGSPKHAFVQLRRKP
jgi:hypothetical protein